MRKYIAWFLCALLLVSTVSALYGISYDTYSGQAARERRAYFDPFSRERYFGEAATQPPFGGFGMKGPVTGTLVGTGRKSAYSGTFNLDTDEFWRRSRTRSSYYDPQMRGFSILDVPVPLYPYAFLQREYPTSDWEDYTHLSKATARVLSLSNPYNSAFRKRPASEVHMKIRELAPLGTDAMYEAWLVDEESEYFQSMGLFKLGIEGTGSLSWSITRPLVAFDKIVVTVEPFPDWDPRPSGEYALVGNIPKGRIALPQQGPGVTIR